MPFPTRTPTLALTWTGNLPPAQVQRKHHCRYCGQIFVSDVCRKTSTIPGKGPEAVRVCDVCFDQLERGDPVCICKQVRPSPKNCKRK